jgi:hypothetical protein
VAEEKEYDRIEKLLSDSGFRGIKPLRIAPKKDEKGEEANADRLKEIVSIYNLNTVIFSGEDVPSYRIIGIMANTEDEGLRFKIAPPESPYIIGSNSIEKGGDVYIMDLNAITKPSNRRRKRTLDIFLSLIFLFTFPVIVWGINEKGGFFKNIFDVLVGKKTWVGYAQKDESEGSLPRIQKGVLSPIDKIRYLKSPKETAKKLDAVYAREYGLRKDLAIISGGFNRLGRRI